MAGKRYLSRARNLRPTGPRVRQRFERRLGYCSHRHSLSNRGLETSIRSHNTG